MAILEGRTVGEKL